MEKDKAGLFSRESILCALAEEIAGIHPAYGDLREPGAVSLPSGDGKLPYPVVREPLYVHLTATMRCGARCRGCINSAITLGSNASEDLPTDTVPKRDARAIRRLIERDGANDVLVCFYGGEPLLVPGKVVETMRLLRAEAPVGVNVQFMIYTNGTHLAKAIERFPELATDVWLYSVSIDGGLSQHNLVRPGADLARIHANLKHLADKRKGHVLMWSTLREGQSLLDCFEEFMALYRRGRVNQFFWHWVETPAPYDDLGQYMQRYEEDLRAVLDTYVSMLEKGTLLPIAHINELMLYHLTGHARGTTACGVEVARNYDIVGGEVKTCADLPPEHTMGTIHPDGTMDLHELNLGQLTLYKKDLGCYQCGVHGYCGGRCPVQALTATARRMAQYCILMRLHVAVVGEYVPAVARGLREHNLSLQDVYDRSAHFAQFTDVTP